MGDVLLLHMMNIYDSEKSEITLSLNDNELLKFQSHNLRNLNTTRSSSHGSEECEKVCVSFLFVDGDTAMYLQSSNTVRFVDPH